MIARIKTPCLALISSDCREGSPASGKYAIYEGYMPISIKLYGEDGEHDQSLSYSDSVLQDLKAAGYLEFFKFTRDAIAELGIDVRRKRTSEERAADTKAIEERAKQLKAEHGPTKSYFFRTNPRLRLKDGSVIWGCECWWKPVESKVEGEELEKVLESMKAQTGDFIELFKAVLEAVEVAT